MNELSSGKGFALGSKDLDPSFDVFTDMKCDFQQVPWTLVVLINFNQCLKILEPMWLYNLEGILVIKCLPR